MPVAVVSARAEMAGIGRILPDCLWKASRVAARLRSEMRAAIEIFSLKPFRGAPFESRLIARFRLTFAKKFANHGHR